MDHPHTALALEFLVFNLGAVEYGIPLQQVQELRASERVTRMAGAPDFLLGVSNLRGVIVPILDLRLCLGMSASARGPGSVSVILQHDGALCGLVVDGVSEVVTLAAAQIRPAPDGSGGLTERHLLGIGTLEQRLLILIDLAGLLAEMGMLPAMALAA
jgi:purine-binding chemotaxis protein CheW